LVATLSSIVAAAAQTTTTTIPAQAIDPTSTAADNPAQRTLLWIIGALVVLGVVVLAFTVVFWRRTRPASAGASAAADPGSEREGSRVSAAELTGRARPVARVAVVTAASPDDLRSVPTWAEDPGDPSARQRGPQGRRVR
jgi:hypothetical protein